MIDGPVCRKEKGTSHMFVVSLFNPRWNWLLQSLPELELSERFFHRNSCLQFMKKSSVGNFIYILMHIKICSKTCFTLPPAKTSITILRQNGKIYHTLFSSFWGLPTKEGRFYIILFSSF